MNVCKITDLRVPAIIGIYSHEKEVPQTLVISLTFQIDLEKPAKTDCLTDTIDYSLVRKAILKFASESRFALLEAFSSHLSNTLKTMFNLSWLELSVTKRPVDMPDLNGVTIVVRDES